MTAINPEHLPKYMPPAAFQVGDRVQWAGVQGAIAAAQYVSYHPFVVFDDGTYAYVVECFLEKA